MKRTFTLFSADEVNPFFGRGGLCLKLGLLLILSVATAKGAEPCGRGAYPWEKEGPSVPEFVIQPITNYPALLINPADVPEVKRRFEAMPDHPVAKPKEMGSALYALLYGDDRAKRQATRDFMTRVRGVYTKNGTYGFGTPNPLTQKRRTNELLYDYDVIVSFGYLTPQEIQEFKDDVIRAVGYFIGNDPARFPCKATPNPNPESYSTGFAAGNRWTDAFLTAGLAGLTFPELPQSRAWVAYAIQQTLFQLEAGDMDGAWIEVPRYHAWTMLLFSGWLAALKHRTGVDLYDNPHLKSLADWPVRFSSPLVRFPQLVKAHPGGVPCNPAWGDSDYDNHFHVCGIYGTAYAKSDPEFAKRLMWMWRRAGSPYLSGWQFSLIFPMLVDPSLPDAPQELGSAFCKRPGYVALRSGFDTPDETWVTMRGGKANNHRRDDLGSIDIFSHGIPLACGAQSGPYHAPEIFWNKWVGANNTVAFVGKENDGTAKSPNRYVDSPGLQSVPSGTPLAFFTSPTVDYAVADCSRPQSKHVSAENAFQWVRHLVLVKKPDYLLVLDRCDSAMASKWFLHTTATNFIWEQRLITAQTAFGADLDIHVLSPSTKLTPNMKEGPFGNWSTAASTSGKEEDAADRDEDDDNLGKRKANFYPFKMLHYFTLDAPPGTDYLTVLQPRKPGDPHLVPTVVSTAKDSMVVQVSIAGRTDVITLTPQGGSYQRGDEQSVHLPLSLP